VSDAELLKTATELRRGMIGNKSSKDHCYIVSNPLQAYLEFMGVICFLVEGTVDGRHHWWVGLVDGRIVDATADQFTVKGKRLPPVVAGNPPNFYKPYSSL